MAGCCANAVLRSAPPRLLFASWHCLIDPSSGAAVSARELLALLAQRGWDVRVLCGPAIDFEQGEDIRQLLADQHLAFREVKAVSATTPFTILSCQDGGIRSSVFLPPDRQQRAPSAQTGREFLRLTEQACTECRPDILLTYGGYWLAAPMLKLARDRGMRTVFWLRNFAYRDAALFRLVGTTPSFPRAARRSITARHWASRAR